MHGQNLIIRRAFLCVQNLTSFISGKPGYTFLDIYHDFILGICLVADSILLLLVLLHSQPRAHLSQGKLFGQQLTCLKVSVLGCSGLASR